MNLQVLRGCFSIWMLWAQWAPYSLQQEFNPPSWPWYLSMGRGVTEGGVHESSPCRQRFDIQRQLLVLTALSVVSSPSQHVTIKAVLVLTGLKCSSCFIIQHFFKAIASGQVIFCYPFGDVSVCVWTVLCVDASVCVICTCMGQCVSIYEMLIHTVQWMCHF